MGTVSEFPTVVVFLGYHEGIVCCIVYYGKSVITYGLTP